MQIITIDNVDFPHLMNAFGDAKDVGRYWRNGQVQVVRATTQFLLVFCESNPGKIAIKPARNLTDACNLGTQLLIREEARGNRIEVSTKAQP
ncbi:MAG: hypothetical protein K1X79_13100 [Oligoflexia bacterium]|nr:hypothetical protein [Oligoflexia bacterium]